MLLVIERQFVSVALMPSRMAVGQYFNVVVANGIHGSFGAFDVGLADIQMKDTLASSFCLYSKGHQFTDGRGRHRCTACRQLRHDGKCYKKTTAMQWFDKIL